MERTTFSVLFYIRRNCLNKAGEAYIFLRLTVNGVRVDTSVKKRIVPELWSPEKGRAIEKNAYAKELNLYLDSINH